MKLDDPQRFAEASKELLAAVCLDVKNCAETATWVGVVHRKRGEWGAAVVSFERATRELPTVERWLQLSAAADKAGLDAKSTHALKRAAKLDGSNVELKKRLESRRRRKLERRLR